MSDLSQQVTAIEKEIRETPYHKGTEHHIGKLRARLAKLKDRLLQGGDKKSGGGGGGYSVKKQGDATVVLIGPPSAGKSTLINKITNAESKVAPYAFTTVSVIPGMLKFKDAYIQILDVPGLIEGAKEGKGKGKEVLSVARASDLLIIMVDVERKNSLDKLTNELEGAGIRVNGIPPEVLIDKKAAGGLIIHSNVKQDLSKETIKEVAMEFGAKNAEITIKEKITLDRLIDAFSQNRVYVPALFILNKIDESPNIHLEKDILAMSAETGKGISELKDAIWNKLGLIRVYLVRPDENPSFKHPIIAKKGEEIKDVAAKVGSDFAEGKKLAKIWGYSARFPGQEVSLSTRVQEGMQIRFL
ncbi:50S ribosome-binding GTPase [Candidatus Woesebacteria bacterium]|nr:50S ribosome-binding GTPase [Candidatus Woesebacteria bacterium]